MTQIWFDLLIVFSLLSLAANIFLGLYSLKSKKQKVEYTYDARALMRDLSSGPALVKIEYIDRGDVLLRSPRHFS